MSRRTQRGEFEIGSDSFLDVIANIVGILIILIVIVGVRMADAPVQRSEMESASQSEPPPPMAAPTEIATADPPTVPESEPESRDPIEVAQPAPRRFEPESKTAPLPAPPKLPSPELTEEANALREAIAALEEKQSQAMAAVKRAQENDAKIQQRLAATQSTVESAASLDESILSEVDELKLSVTEIAERLASARRQLEALEKTKPPAETIKHRVTPVSRTVKGDEIHFHLAKGRVTPIPLDDLIERLRGQISRQKDWLAKYRKHQGEIGPVGGFTMQYVVEREDVPVVDELRQGSGMMKIGVSQWQLLPDPDLDGESASQALRPGSAFLRAIRQAKPDSTLTLWVYPDSFPLYRALTQFAHREGYTVAARPLPHGMPIAGSPQGTRSAGQ